MLKIYFYILIKLILIIFFIEDYFCDKNLKISILKFKKKKKLIIVLDD